LKVECTTPDNTLLSYSLDSASNCAAIVPYDTMLVYKNEFHHGENKPRCITDHGENKPRCITDHGENKPRCITDHGENKPRCSTDNLTIADQPKVCRCKYENGCSESEFLVTLFLCLSFSLFIVTGIKSFE